MPILIVHDAWLGQQPSIVREVLAVNEMVHRAPGRRRSCRLCERSLLKNRLQGKWFQTTPTSPLGGVVFWPVVSGKRRWREPVSRRVAILRDFGGTPNFRRIRDLPNVAFQLDHLIIR